MWLNAMKSRALLVIVIYTNFLDYLLLTSVVPIIPDFLVETDTEDAVVDSVHNISTLIHHNFTDIMSLFNETSTNETVTEKTFFERILHIPVRAINENSRVGWLLGSKALVQMVANPVVGYLSNRVSYRNLLLFGTFIFLTSSSLFAVAESYVPLLIARASQGIGSAATTIAGMSMIAESYKDDNDRSRAMGFAMGGYALGILVGYPFGGLLYAVSGKTAPFVGIFIFCLFNMGFQFWCLVNFDDLTQSQMRASSLYKLLADPYVLLCAGALMITSMSLAVLESTVPIWMMDTMHVQQWQLGLIFIPDSVGYLVGTNAFPVIAKKYGRWIFTLASMFLIGVGMVVIPFCSRLGQLLIPHLSLGLGVGVTDAAVMPLLALLVDQRHVSTYGSVYAIVQLAICLAYSLGPALAGQIVKYAGFKWSMWGMSILNILYMPLCAFLRSPPIADDAQCIMQDLRHEEGKEEDNDDCSAKYRSIYLE